MQQQRDLGIDHIRARKNNVAYGMGLGVLLLDDVYPGFPGDVRNASAYPYPMQYEIVEGLDIDQLVFHVDRETQLPLILKAAKKLERLGVRAIAAECGYFAYFQQEVAAELDIPVFMSSLLQVPFIQQVVGVKNQVGILCAFKSQLSPQHLSAVGADPNSNLVIAGALDDYESPELSSLWDAQTRPDIPVSNYQAAEANMVRVCQDFVKKNPNIQALMFECTGFQPFARAVQREIGIPVFSWSTLLDYAYSVVVHRDFYGHV